MLTEMIERLPATVLVAARMLEREGILIEPGDTVDAISLVLEIHKLKPTDFDGCECLK